MMPLQSQSVTVVGEVQYATSHIYDSSLSVNDYIERSGGANLKADKNRIYVVRAMAVCFCPVSRVGLSVVIVECKRVIPWWCRWMQRE